MQQAKLVIILTLSFIVVYGLTYFLGINFSSGRLTAPKAEIVISGQAISVEVAGTPDARERGLSGRESLKDNEGMLFIFDPPERPGFWMKEMNFPIDIIWINEENLVSYISKNLLPSSYPQIFYPKTKAKYVLEVKAGFVEKNHTKAGDRIVVRQQ